jgi:hypothetical protein
MDCSADYDPSTGAGTMVLYRGAAAAAAAAAADAATFKDEEESDFDDEGTEDSDPLLYYGNDDTTALVLHHNDAAAFDANGQEATGASDVFDSVDSNRSTSIDSELSASQDDQFQDVHYHVCAIALATPLRGLDAFAFRDPFGANEIQQDPNRTYEDEPDLHHLEQASGQDCAELRSGANSLVLHGPYGNQWTALGESFATHFNKVCLMGESNSKSFEYVSPWLTQVKVQHKGMLKIEKEQYVPVGFSAPPSPHYVVCQLSLDYEPGSILDQKSKIENSHRVAPRPG